MADVGGDSIWKRKFLTLESRIKLVELENQKIVNRIYHVRKHLKRSRLERSFLVKKCEQYGIDYEKAQPEYMATMLAEINAASYEDTCSQFKKSTELTRKGKSRAHHKVDPNAPKKPANAFFMFCQQQRNSMHDEQKDSTVGHHELTKHLAKEWNTLGAEGKKVYYKMYEKDKVRYEKEMRQYTKEKPVKEPTKLLKTKNKKATKKALKSLEHSKSGSAPPQESVKVPAESDNTGSLVSESPATSFSLLNALPFSNLPSPMLEIGEEHDEESFNSFDYSTV